MFVLALAGALMGPRRWVPKIATGGSPFSPVAPFAQYDADLGVYEDAGTDPAENDDPVYQWNDQSGNGYHLVQSASDNRPILKTAYHNSHNAIQFDGVNDFIQVNLGTTKSQVNTVGIVFYVVDPAVERGQYLLDSDNGTTRTVINVNSTNHRVEAYAGSSLTTTTDITGSWHYAVITYNNTSSTIRIDGAAVSTTGTGTGTQGVDSIRLGSRFSGATVEPLEGWIGYVVFFNGSLGAPQLAALESLLAAR